MTRKISVELVGDDQSLQRAFKRSSSGAKTFERDIGKASRGAIAASLSFRGLGRSAAFASGYLIGGAGLAYGLKKSVEGAESLEKAQRSLGVVIRRNGGDFKDQLPQIEHWAAAQSRFGVSTVQSEQGLARATVITGSAVKGMRAYTEALEISKATGRSFTTVLLAAAKANEGQTTALARYIGKIPTGTSTMKLFTDIQAKYKGQADANTTATEKLGAALSNIETTVGTALLPTINKYASELTAWLGKSKNQERLQRDVNEAMRDATSVFKAVTTLVNHLSHAMGGLERVGELLIGLKLASKLQGWSTAFGQAGGAAAVANGKVATLRGSLLGLSGLTIAPIVIPIIAKYDNKLRSHGKGGKLLSDVAIPSQGVSDAAGWLWKQITKPGKDAYVNNTKNTSGMSNDPMHDAVRAAAASSGGSGSSSAAGAGLDGLSSIQNAVSSARLGVARGDAGAKQQLVTALKAQIDYDRKYEGVQAGLIKRRVGDVKKHAQTLQRLQADEAGALDEITSMNTKTAKAEDSAAKKAAALAKKRRDAAKAKAAKAAQAAQTFTVPINLLIAQAKAGTTASTADDIAVAKKIKAFAEKTIRSNKKKGMAIVDAWNEIANDMQTIGTKQASQYAAVSSRMLTAGLNISKGTRLAIESRIAQSEAHRGTKPGGVGALGQTVIISGPVHVHGVNDPKQLIDKLQKHATRGSASTRGTHAGEYLGLH